MRELMRDEMAILDQITSADRALVDLEILADGNGTLAGLILEGLVELWDGVGKTMATLTPLGAEVLGVVLVEYAETLPPTCSPGRRNGDAPGRSTDPYPCSFQDLRWDMVNPTTCLGVHEPRYVILPRHPHRVLGDILAYIPAPDPGPDVLRRPDGKPVRLFAGGNPGDDLGYMIPIDRRLERRRMRHRGRARQA